MTTTLLTGLPRSGTNLFCTLLNEQADTIALSEPDILRRYGDAAQAMREIDIFIALAREAALKKGVVPTRAADGSVPENWAEEPHDGGALRKVRMRSEYMPVGKALAQDFHLIVKWPALFTALARPLREKYPLIAIVRHPLAVLASWQTVDMPVNNGRMPMAEAFDARLKETLEQTPDRLQRQIVLIDWMLRIYAAFPRSDVLRYEDLVANPLATLQRISPAALPPQRAIRDKNPAERYRQVDFRVLADALTAIVPAAEVFYPDFSASLSQYRKDRSG